MQAKHKVNYETIKFSKIESLRIKSDVNGNPI